jgi:proteasome assembly chaperone (PAC2) family protein
LKICSEWEARATRDLTSFSSQPEFRDPSLVVGFAEDAGGVGGGVAQHLIAKLDGESFCDVDPAAFFPLGGVTVQDDVAQFPEDKLYSVSRPDLVVFSGNEPRLERLEFLRAVLDVAEHYCRVVEMYTVSGIMSSIAHTTPRSTLAVFNQPDLQKRLRTYDLDSMTWEGQPALNSFLLWAAQRRDIPGVSLWPTVPFYLASVGDPAARRKVLQFLDTRFELGLDLSDLQAEVAKQNERLAELRSSSSEVDNLIEKLEVSMALTQEEGEKLTTEVTEFLRRGD